MGLIDIVPTKIEGCFELKPRVFEDQRGKFVKVFHKETFKELGLIESFEEEYISTSIKGVIRGLHFQNPPEAHVKVVTSLYGKILDIVVDLRKNSKTYGQHHTTTLDSSKGNMVYVPEGMAHGIYSINGNNLFLSMNSKKFSPLCDDGILWSSIDFEWPERNPIVSEKDNNMIAFKDFKSPF